MIETRLGPDVLDAFMSDLVSGAFSYDCAADDLTRIRQLTARYRYLSLGVADAAVIACAERLRAGILTFDRRDFDVVARETGMSIIPSPVADNANEMGRLWRAGPASGQ